MKTIRFLVTIAALGTAQLLAAASEGAGPAGHWESAITLPQGSLPFGVDLVCADDGTWSGWVDVPFQGIRHAALQSVDVTGADITLRLPDAFGGAQFAGKFDHEADTVAGTFSQGMQTFACELARREPTPDTLPATPEHGVAGTGLAGTWQGTLPVGNVGLRIRLNAAVDDADGMISATLDTLDQGGFGIPISSFTESEGAVRLDVTVIGGVFEGNYSSDGSELVGQWTQGGQALPLVFKRLPRISTAMATATLSAPAEVQP